MEAIEEESESPSEIEIDTKPNFYSVSSESEEMEKSDGILHVLKLDECCLLCGQLAITYDSEGNVVKREREDDETGDGIESQRHQFTYQDLFSFLCRCLKVKKEEWSFHTDSKDLFPFCEMCEFLLVSLAEVYCRLDELGEVLRGKMVEAEEDKFWKEALYVKHNRRYLTFRKQVLKDKFKGDKIQKKSNLPNPVGIMSSIRVAKSDIVNCKVPLSPVEPGDSEPRQLRSRSCKIMNNNSSHASLKTHEGDSDFSIDDEEPEVDMDDLLQNDCHSSTTSDYASDDISDNDFNKKTVSKTKRTSQKRNVRANKKSSLSNLDPLSNSGRRIANKYVRKHNSKRRTPVRKARVRNPRKPENSTWKSDNSGFMLINPETGNITYSTGYGNRFRSTRTVLEFTKLGDKGGYQCCTCLDVIPHESQRLNQQSRFRTHFIQTHSPRYMCRLCPNPNRCSSSEELLQHAILIHGLPDLQTYHKRVGSLRLKDSMEKRIEVRKKRSILYSDNQSSCQICGMPFINLEVNTIREHNKSHLNDEEKQEIEQMDDNLSMIKTYQCHTCGKSLQGALSLRSHMRIHSEEKTVCRICGEAVQWLGPHMKKAHSKSACTTNDDKNCKVCGMSFIGLRKYKIRGHMRSHRSLKNSIESKQEEMSLDTQNKPNCVVNVNAIREHNKSHLNDEEGQEIDQMDYNLPLAKTYQCHICGQTLRSSRTLAIHEEGHINDQRGSICNICGETFKCARYINKHIAKAHPDGTLKSPFSCNYPSCGRSLENDSNLLAHVEKEHSRSEEANKKIMCFKCGKVLASSWAAKLHGLVHSKERNFKCEVCSKTFPLKTTLENHLAAIHRVGWKSSTFKCDQQGCGGEFRSNVYLKGHLRRVHGVYMRKDKKQTVAKQKT